MLSTTRTIIITVVTAVAALAIPASSLAQNPAEWNYVRDHRTSPVVAQPLPNHLYELILPGEYVGSTKMLVSGFQSCHGAAVGAELEWARAAGPRSLVWEFRRQPGHPATQLVTGAERIALYNHAIGKYLIREHQYFGISLGFSATPSYEWQIADGEGNPDGSLAVGAELYNTNEQGYLVRAGFSASECAGGLELTWLHAPFSLPEEYNAPPESGQFREKPPREGTRPEGPPIAPESTPPPTRPGPPPAAQ